jgi:8-amino-7-oxononanoate synthase
MLAERLPAPSPYFMPFGPSPEPGRPLAVARGRTVVMFGSNDYLGLTQHPEVRTAAVAAIECFGTGCSGSRLLNGSTELHGRLEAELARFMGREAALVFGTGYQTNVGALSAIAGTREALVMDRNVHASLLEGGLASFARTVRFRHSDVRDLDAALGSLDDGEAAIVVVDGVYSMEGDLAPLGEIAATARRHGARLYVDEAHAVGVLGESGRGTAEHLGVEASVDLVMGTFSKSLASIGGFVAASENIIHYLRHNSRPLIFTAALPPANTAGVLAALEVLQQEPERRMQLWANTRRLHDGFRQLGFDIGPTETPIVPVLIGPLEKTFLFWRKLFDAGVFTNPVAPPAVHPTQCRLRTSLMATHTFDQIDFALDAFAKVGRELGVI